jgi:hypothetical protein
VSIVGFSSVAASMNMPYKGAKNFGPRVAIAIWPPAVSDRHMARIVETMSSAKK